MVTSARDLRWTAFLQVCLLADYPEAALSQPSRSDRTNGSFRVARSSPVMAGMLAKAVISTVTRAMAAFRLSPPKTCLSGHDPIADCASSVGLALIFVVQQIMCVAAELISTHVLGRIRL